MNKDYGFGDELDRIDVDEWAPESLNDEIISPRLEQVKKVAEKAGFTSREPAKRKEPDSQITIRGKYSVIEGFRDFASDQEPKWPLGYALERALIALKRELEG